MNATTEAAATQLGLVARASSHPYATALLVLIASALLLNAVSRKASKQVNLPAWVPIEIALTSVLVASGGLGLRLCSMLRRRTGALFGVTSKHSILLDIKGQDRFFAAPSSSLSGHMRDWTMTTRVFGMDATDELFDKANASSKGLYVAVERLFVNDAASTAAILRADVPGKIARLATFSPDAKLQKWELSAQRRIIDDKAVEVSLAKLLRDFGACIAIPLLYGQDFVDRYETILSDLWSFDNDAFPLLIIGVPKWAPIKGLREGVAARSRMHKELEGLYRRITQYQNGEPVDFDADMSDVSAVALERNKVYIEHGYSVHHRGQSDLGIFWAQNGNTQPLLFWFIGYVYSTPGLLDSIRKEVAPYVQLAAANPGDEPEITSYDPAGLSRDCPLLKSALFETFRLTSEPTSIRYLNRPLTLHAGGHTHDLKAGTWLSAPHAVAQYDPELYPDPTKFDPARFIEEDESGRRIARYGKLKPWGLGTGICKGRTFAEKEILAIGAAIVTLWDMEPADGAAWKMPGTIPGTGVKKPTEDMRVILRKRSWAA
ncbi:uncharacterized protein E0L32_002296 [Thyridium curvatum]|uniref:Cytochrome P450 n=1 Tax=Thyridium curvatum TaxID=1093900 RepID=A0A507ARK0_9PEZI|nr:uncharacterized protein E0L32_002296 [Thyridium curvatum]TPX06800.1 hypothetical protein E0L32_002296 [Thyridium curvatum]